MLPAPQSYIHKMMNSPARATITNITKRKLFGVSARPLPEAPDPDEGGEIYCVIEDDDHYELSEADGSHLMPHDKSRVALSTPLSAYASRMEERTPPPLPQRGPPPVPNFKALPPKPSHVVPPLLSDPDLEDYDIPEDLDAINQAVNKTLVLSNPLESEDVAPLPQDLSVVLPSYPLSPRRNEEEQPPLPEKGGAPAVAEEDDNVYKVPTIHVSEDIYKVPPPDPVPVGNNNDNHNNNNNNIIKSEPIVSKTEHKNSVLENTTEESSELYQIPSSDIIPVSSSTCKPTSKIPLSTSKQSQSAKGVSNGVSNEVARANIFPGSKGTSSVNVKERVALINKKKETSLTKCPINSSSDVVVMLGNKEIKLDQDKKKAFLESTLKFDKKQSPQDIK